MSMEPKVILFSSDATDLYKGDIFRVLALPKSDTIQFRYERQYVLPAYRNAPETLIGNEALIFFLSGNDLTVPVQERKLKPHPVRSCTIQHAFNDPNTQQIILILRLGAFANCSIESITDPSHLPPTAFVTKANVEDLREVDWFDRVKAVQPHFPGILFYKVEVLAGEKTVTPTYSSGRHCSYYSLEEESEYALECSYFDPGGGSTPLEIEVSADEVDVRNSFDWGAGARLDTRRLPITTRTLKSRSVPAYIKFHSPKPAPTQPNMPRDPNFVEIHWQLQQKSSKPLRFTGLTFLGAVGLMVAQSGLRDSKGVSLSLTEAVIRLAGAALVGVAGGLLFKFFNKI